MLANNPFCYFTGVKSRSIRIWINPSIDWWPVQYPPLIDVSLCFVLLIIYQSPHKLGHLFHWDGGLEKRWGVEGFIKLIVLLFRVSVGVRSEIPRK